MEFSEALEKAEGNENVQSLKGFFLGSSFASISTDKQAENGDDVNEWTLLYYSPTKKSVVDCFVSEKIVTVGEETPAIKEMHELQVTRVKVPLHEALSLADGHVKKRPLNILISLHTKDIGEKTYIVWTMGFVTAEMTVISVDIDATNGKVLKEETTRLIRRL